MTVAVVRRWLKVPDPTALTARHALQHLLGYKTSLEDLARAELLVFRWDDAVNARALLSRLARETNLLQNPNKHEFEIVAGLERLNPRGNAWVLTSEPGSGDAIATSIARRRLLPGEPPRVARAVLWELTLAASAGGRSVMAREIAETRSRNAGLLANPHLEDLSIFETAPTAQEIADVLAWEGAEAGELG